MVALWFILLVACILGAAVSSRKAVTAALEIVESTRFSPALVGLTIMSIGTDLPEIANSIVSVSSGHGDVNVGDSMGSVLTQITLVLGILCLVSTSLSVERNFLISIGSAAFFASVVVWVFVRDGVLSHFDGAILVLLWFGGTVLLGQSELRPREVVQTENVNVSRNIVVTLLWLGLVGVFAFGVVTAFLELSEDFGVPEFVGSFIALSLGTSLPELAVDWTAIRKGATSMAIGGIFGSSFVDATLSVGIGPALFSSEVSSDVMLGVGLAAIGVAVATFAVARTKHLDWRLGVLLISFYAFAQVAVAFS